MSPTSLENDNTCQRTEHHVTLTPCAKAPFTMQIFSIHTQISICTVLIVKYLPISGDDDDDDKRMNFNVA